ncbi:MAG: hypothetical protein AAGA76_15750 [Pseudomonadota bacterium]
MLGFLLLTACFLAGCNGELFNGKISEGIIEYQVSYPLEDPDNGMLSFYPDRLIMKFKEHKYKAHLDAGMMEACYIADISKREVVNCLKLLTTRYAVVMDEATVQEHNARYPKAYITETEETKEIAGYTCKKAHVRFEGDSLAPIDVFYTEDIKIKDPNWCNPFPGIKGVLMEYQIMEFDLLMHMQAVSVRPKKIAEEEFELEQNYEVLTYSGFNSEVNKIVKSLQQP